VRACSVSRRGLRSLGCWPPCITPVRLSHQLATTSNLIVGLQDNQRCGLGHVALHQLALCRLLGRRLTIVGESVPMVHLLIRKFYIDQWLRFIFGSSNVRRTNMHPHPICWELKLTTLSRESRRNNSSHV